SDLFFDSYHTHHPPHPADTPQFPTIDFEGEKVGLRGVRGPNNPCARVIAHTGARARTREGCEHTPHTPQVPPNPLENLNSHLRGDSACWDQVGDWWVISGSAITRRTCVRP